VPGFICQKRFQKIENIFFDYMIDRLKRNNINGFKDVQQEIKF
jgi:hypothetical protein